MADAEALLTAAQGQHMLLPSHFWTLLHKQQHRVAVVVSRRELRMCIPRHPTAQNRSYRNLG